MGERNGEGERGRERGLRGETETEGDGREK